MRLSTHIREEGFEAVPAFAHFNAPTSITRIIWPMRIVAPTFHGSPASEFCRVLSDGFSMFVEAMIRTPARFSQYATRTSQITPATNRASIAEVGSELFAGLTAMTEAIPNTISPLCVVSTRENRQKPYCFTSEIDESVHGRIVPCR